MPEGVRDPARSAPPVRWGATTRPRGTWSGEGCPFMVIDRQVPDGDLTILTAREDDREFVNEVRSRLGDRGLLVDRVPRPTARRQPSAAQAWPLPSYPIAPGLQDDRHADRRAERVGRRRPHAMCDPRAAALENSFRLPVLGDGQRGCRAGACRRSLERPPGHSRTHRWRRRRCGETPSAARRRITAQVKCRGDVGRARLSCGSKMWHL